jgi:hypothetical protein
MCAGIPALQNQKKVNETKMRLLLISNSTNAGEAYLDYPKHNIREFLGAKR